MSPTVYRSAINSRSRSSRRATAAATLIRSIGADLGSREIGRILGLEPGAVDVALHRSRERLKHRLRAAGLEPGGQRRIDVNVAAEPFS